MHYVYIIKSLRDGSHYTGTTINLRRRLYEHNEGMSPPTKGRIPYHLVWYSAFTDEQIAIQFEKYLKTGSGIAFARKRLVPVIPLK
jgi:predicted GIY-YIG superfamily endonuclease